jgi:serine protease Do
MNRTRILYAASKSLFLVSLLSSTLMCSSSPSKAASPPVTVSQAASQASAVNGSFKTLFADIASKVTPSVVSVILTKIDTVTSYQNPFSDFFGDSGTDNPFQFFFGNPFSHNGRSPKPEKREYREQGLGSGVIVSPDGYILTNYHVVAGAGQLQVKLADERTFEAKIVGVDSLSDVAVIKIKEKIDNLPAAPLGDDAALRPGDWALAIGNPFSFTSTVTLGIVSALHRQVGNQNLYQNFIQTDAAINPGNSGGALVNVDGQVVGINTMIYTRTGGFMGIGFAIPISMAKSVMDDIIKTGKVTRGWIGVSIQDPNKAMREALNLGSRKGVLVGDVYKGQPAEKAGIKRGDVILSVGGKPTENSNELRNFVAELQPGAKVPFVVLRNGKEMTLELTVAERSEKTVAGLSEKSKAAPTESNGASEKRLGLSLADLTQALRAKYHIDAQEKGVVVLETPPTLTDSRATLREGDVIEQVKVKDRDFANVESLKQLDEVTRHVKKGDSVLLLVVRGAMSLYVGFEL